MNALASKIDGLFITASDIRVITVSGFAGAFSDLTLDFATNDTYEFTTETEAAIKFEELKASGKYHTVSAWAYEHGPNYIGSQIYFEIDTYSTETQHTEY